MVIVISAAFLGGLYAHLNNSGWFEPWRSLGKPPERATRISYDGEGLPLVETSEGTSYVCSTPLSAKQKNCWVKVDVSQLQTKEVYPCDEVDPIAVPKPPGKVSDTVKFESCPHRGLMFSTTRQHNFVLLEDGSVWMWEYSHSVPGFAFFDIYIHTIVGTVLGLILGVVVAVIVVHRKPHKVDAA